MTFRVRLLAGFVAVALVPLAVFGVGVRREIAARLGAQHERRVAALLAVIRGELARDSGAIGGRLAALTRDARADNRLRAAALAGGDAPYLLDYAGTAMRLAGLDMLQLQDSSGRILSSGHFRNEFDRLEPEVPRLLAAAPGGMALVRARTAAAPFLALARVDSFALGGRRFTLVGGLAVDSAYLTRLAPDSELSVALDTLGAPVAADSGAGGGAGAVAGTLELPLLVADAGRLAPARIVVRHSRAELDALRGDVDRWLLAALAATGAVALLLGAWLSLRISRPLTALAAKTAQIDMDRLDVEFASERGDEIGALTRLLGAMTERLRTGASRLREAERRLALGDLARQVNHDVKNGLIPIRNVFRHLTEVARREPDRLGAVFIERQATVESGLSYLEGLAGNYARLYPQAAPAPCDVNALVTDSARRAGDGTRPAPRLDLAAALPPVRADPLVLRRILENLVGNALDATAGRDGGVAVSTAAVTTNGKRLVRITIADTGPGMTRGQLDRAFEGFYTTKPGGSGLGLSIARRLVLDTGGSLKVETEPGAGTRVHVELPCET